MVDPLDVLKDLYPDGGLSPGENDFAVKAVHKHLESAYADGHANGFNQSLKAKKPVSILILSVVLGLLVGGIGGFASRPIFLPPVSFFIEGAPIWEIELGKLTPEEARADPIVEDAITRMGTEWQFSGVAQYKSMVLIRTVNISSQITIYMYRWTPLGGWKYYAEEFQK